MNRPKLKASIQVDWLLECTDSQLLLFLVEESLPVKYTIQYTFLGLPVTFGGSQ